MTVRLRQPGSMEQLRRHNRHLVLRAIYSGAAESRADEVYLPGFWRFVMFGIRSIPESVFKRMKL